MGYREKCLSEKDRRCVVCESTTKVEVHHRDGNRANNELENLIPVCLKCHRNIHAGEKYVWELHEDIRPRARENWMRSFKVKLPRYLIDEVKDASEVEDAKHWEIVSEALKSYFGYYQESNGASLLRKQREEMSEKLTEAKSRQEEMSEKLTEAKSRQEEMSEKYAEVATERDEMRWRCESAVDRLVEKEAEIDSLKKKIEDLEEEKDFADVQDGSHKKSIFGRVLAAVGIKTEAV